MTYGNVPARRVKGKTLLQTIHDVLREIVAQLPWRNESDKVQATGIVNGNDPNFQPPPPSPAQMSLTPEQLQIQALQAQLAQVTGNAAHYGQPNAAQQMAAAQQGLTAQQYAQQAQPQQAQAQPVAPYMGVNPADMRGYQYPQAPAQPGQQAPVFPQPQRAPQPQQTMQTYQYPGTQAPQFQQPNVTPFQ